MPPHEINDRQYLAEQYQDHSHLDARIRLHRLYSTNPQGWFPWMFAVYLANPVISRGLLRVLELGCGAGTLWADNQERIPPDWEITLTDFSPGMLAAARREMEKNPIPNRLKFQVVDCGALPLPFEDGAFDLVIANHMLYHVPDRPGLLAEIVRVRGKGDKPAGSVDAPSFFASTIGERHLAEITELVKRFDPRLVGWGDVTHAFTLENGATQLEAWFTEVKLHRYPDALLVTNAGHLVDYIFSGWLDLAEEHRLEFTRFVEREMKQAGGVLHITKDSGFFEAR